jgi:hypothetical protein
VVRLGCALPASSTQALQVQRPNSGDDDEDGPDDQVQVVPVIVA